MGSTIKEKIHSYWKPNKNGYISKNNAQGLKKDSITMGSEWQKEYLDDGEQKNQLDEMEYFEDFPLILRMVEENELEFQKIQSDLCELELEKSKLESKHKQYQIGILIANIVLCLVVVSSVLGIIFLLLSSRNVFVPAVIFIVSMVFLGFWSIVFRTYFINKMQKNGRLLQRIIKLLNKIHSRNATYSKLLDYEYGK